MLNVITRSAQVMAMLGGVPCVGAFSSNTLATP